MSTLIEILGGLAILAGAFVAAVSIPLIVMMLVAMFTVHLRYGFSAINTIGLTADGPQFGPPGYEVNLLYIAGLLALILGGAGPLSIDRLLARGKREPAAVTVHREGDSSMRNRTTLATAALFAAGALLGWLAEVGHWSRPAPAQDKQPADAKLVC